MQALRLFQFLTLGYTNFGRRGYRNNEMTFTRTALDINLQGRTYVITGATSGLGLATARALAALNGNVHIICRDGTRGEAVRERIMKETGNTGVQMHVLDISDLGEVERFSNRWKEDGTKIEALVNNAGVMTFRGEVSVDGVELGFATNTVGTYLLTERLLPWLEGGRVVTVSSGGMLTEGLVGGGEVGGGIMGYSRCKRQQVALTEHWARRYEGKDVFWASMHPGWAETPGLEKSIPGFFKFMKHQLRTQEEGADTIVYLAASEEAVRFPSGEFFFDRKPAMKHLWLGGTWYDEKEVDCLVESLEQLIEEKGVKVLDYCTKLCSCDRKLTMKGQATVSCEHAAGKTSKKEK